MKRTLLIGMILGALIGSWVIWMPVVVRAVACTPLGTTTAILALCKPATGEVSWGAAVNANYDAIDALFTGSSVLLPANGGVPVGSILMIDSGTCGTGYTEVTAMRGFYARGMLAAGEAIGTTVGTALTASENRTVGQHNHQEQVALTGGASDSVVGATYATGGGGSNVQAIVATNTCAGVCSAPTAINTANSGSVAGTAAPYRLVMFCKKT